jgi:hypothetical protein
MLTDRERLARVRAASMLRHLADAIDDESISLRSIAEMARGTVARLTDGPTPPARGGQPHRLRIIKGGRS